MTYPETMNSSIPKRQKVSHGVDTSAIIKNPIDETTGLSQCFHKVTATMHVSLAPMYSTTPAIGIKSQHLDPLLMTWYSPVGGIVLAYENLRLLGQDENSFYDKEEENDSSNSYTKVAKVIHESPFAFSWIAVDFLVWKPQQEDRVEGIINLQAPSHISLLIHDVFHASIRRESLPDDWEFVYHEADEAYYEGEEETANVVDSVVESMDKDGDKKKDNKEGEDKNDEKNTASKSIGYWVDGNGEKIVENIKFIIRRVMVTGRLISVQGTLRADGSFRAFDNSARSDKPYSKHGYQQGSDSNDSFGAATGTHKKFSEDEAPKLNKRKVFTDDDDVMTAMSDKINKDIEESTTEEQQGPKLVEAVSSVVASGEGAPQYAEESDSDEDSD